MMAQVVRNSLSKIEGVSLPKDYIIPPSDLEITPVKTKNKTVKEFRFDIPEELFQERLMLLDRSVYEEYIKPVEKPAKKGVRLESKLIETGRKIEERKKFIIKAYLNNIRSLEYVDIMDKINQRTEINKKFSKILGLSEEYISNITSSNEIGENKTKILQKLSLKETLIREPKGNDYRTKNDKKFLEIKNNEINEVTNGYSPSGNINTKSKSGIFIDENYLISNFRIKSSKDKLKTLDINEGQFQLAIVKNFVILPDGFIKKYHKVFLEVGRYKPSSTKFVRDEKKNKVYFNSNSGYKFSQSNNDDYVKKILLEKDISVLDFKQENLFKFEDNGNGEPTMKSVGLGKKFSKRYDCWQRIGLRIRVENENGNSATTGIIYEFKLNVRFNRDFTNLIVMSHIK